MTCSEFDVLGFSNTKNFHLPYKNSKYGGSRPENALKRQKSEISFVSDVINEAYSIFKHLTH